MCRQRRVLQQAGVEMPSDRGAMRRAGRCCAGLVLVLALGVIVGPAVSGAEETARVTVPLESYMKLLLQARQVDEQAARARLEVEPDVAQVVSQETRVRIEAERAEVESRLEIEVRGKRLEPVPIPVTGLIWNAEVEPAEGAALASTSAGVRLIASEPGRYTVRLEATAAVDDSGGVSTLKLAPVVAPVAVTEVDLPAELAWTCGGAVVAEDEVRGARRHLRLGLAQGTAHQMELRREVRGEVSERVLARASVTTLIQLSASGVRRHDVVLVDVSRGSLAELEVELPAGLEVLRLATDEGEVPPLVDGTTLKVRRTRRLERSGYLVITSQPADARRVLLDPVLPAVETRGRTLALATEIAAEPRPVPEERWARADIDDLPAELRRNAEALGLVAAWRWRDRIGTEASGQVAVDDAHPALELDVPPVIEALPTLISSRTTTTLLTVEGTLLHRDRLLLAEGGAGLELELAPGSTLWSCSVDNEAVRPVERDGVTVIPLAFGGGEGAEVELITVQEQAIPERRERITFGVPRLRAPVLQHEWRLLLPEGHRYRFVSGALAPVPPLQDVIAMAGSPLDTSGFEAKLRKSSGGTVLGVVVDEGNEPLPGVTLTLVRRPSNAQVATAITDPSGRFFVTGLPSGTMRIVASLSGYQRIEQEGLKLQDGTVLRLDLTLRSAFTQEVVVTAETPIAVDRRLLEEKGRASKQAEAIASSNLADAELSNLRTGLVGGVKPVPIAVPESGKSLLLVGLLPPPDVTVELEVKDEGGWW